MEEKPTLKDLENNLIKVLNDNIKDLGLYSEEIKLLEVLLNNKKRLDSASI